jgi:hypothetical protein
MFWKRRASEGPTEKDAILRNIHIAATSQDAVLQKHDIQNQVVIIVDLTSTSKHTKLMQGRVITQVG